MKMKDLMEEDIPLRLFVIVPMLLYTGYSIQREKTHASSVMFHAIVVLLVAITLFFHVRYLYRVLRHVFRNKEYQKDFGIFLMTLAVSIMFLCMYDIYEIKIHRK